MFGLFGLCGPLVFGVWMFGHVSVGSAVADISADVGTGLDDSAQLDD